MECQLYFVDTLKRFRVNFFLMNNEKLGMQ